MLRKLIGLALLLGIAAPPLSAPAQDLPKTEGATILRLDAVDPKGAEQGNFVFFVSFLDKYRKPLEAYDPKEWTIIMDGQPVGNPLQVKKLADSDQFVNLVIVLQADIAAEEYFTLAKDKAKKLLNGLRATGDTSVAMIFGNTIENSGTLSAAHNTAQNWLDEKKPDGTTPALLEAVQGALRLFPSDFTSIGRNRAVLVVGDGMDKDASFPNKIKDLTDQIKNEAGKKRVHIHTIYVPPPEEEERRETEKRIRKLSDLTGGTYRAATAGVGEVGNYMENFGAELMGQHVLYFQTLDFEGDKDINYKLELSHEGQRFPSSALTEKTSPPKSNVLKYLAIVGGALGGLLLLWILIRLIRGILASRRPVEVVQTGPETRPCTQCNNAIPIEWKVCQYCEALPHKGKLRVVSSGELNAKVWFIKENLTNIGSAEGNAIVIPDKSVSKRHAGIKVQDARFELADYGSTNGVMVNGQRITKQFLKSGDVVSIGAVEMEFTLK
jgi:hypothetical protein